MKNAKIIEFRKEEEDNRHWTNSASRILVRKIEEDSWKSNKSQPLIRKE